jgi:RNA polymerase sigma factor (sigma-70 family)
MDDDRSLLQAWSTGDRRSGQQLFARYHKPLTRFFINKVQTLDEVEDLVQRCFLAAIESSSRFRGQSSVRTWLFGIGRNLLRQHYEARRRHASDGDAEQLSVADFDVPGASTWLRGKAEQLLLLRALRRLPIETQVALELFYWEELTAAEIGEVLGMPEGTTRSKLRKAKAGLRDAIAMLAKDSVERESTVSNLDGWAADLRTAWGP